MRPLQRDLRSIKVIRVTYPDHSGNLLWSSATYPDRLQLTLIDQLAYPDNPGHPWASCAGRDQGCLNCGVISFCRNLFSRGKSALSHSQTSKVFGGYMREVVDWAPPYTKHNAVELNWGQHLSILQTNFESDFVVNATAAETPTVNKTKYKLLTTYYP